MKTNQTLITHGLPILLGMAAFLVTGNCQAWADDHRDGYWDSHHQYHHYSYYHNHRGYWDQRNGIRVWINI